MTYASEVDLDAAYGAEAITALADRDGDGARDAGAIDAALQDADAEIDAYLSSRYALPLPDGQRRFLRRYAVDIAVYRLSTDAGLLNDDRRARFRDAQKALKMLGSGELRLGASDPPGGPRVRKGPRFRSAPRRFSRDTMGLG